MGSYLFKESNYRQIRVTLKSVPLFMDILKLKDRWLGDLEDVIMNI